MKNRLQFNRMPKLYASREEATAALELHYKDSSFIPLIGEPLVVRYYDVNGKKQAILAIGKATGQTAEDKIHREYHIIDTAEINENVSGASFSAETALELASATTQSVNNYFQILRNMIEAEGIDLDDGSYFDDDDPTKDPSTCGKYKPLENSNYLDDAKNLREADKLLDEAIGGVSDDLDELSATTINLSAGTVAVDVKVDALSANTMAADRALKDELNDKIDELSANTMAADEALDNKIDELSANTMAADQELADRIEDLEGRKVLGNLSAITVNTLENGDSRVSLVINEEDDKILSQNALGLKAKVTLDYVSADKKIYLKGKNDIVISEIDATDFIKDGMLSAASVFTATESDHQEYPELVVGETYIKLLFNVDGEEPGRANPVFISARDLVDIYTVNPYSGGTSMMIDDYIITLVIDNALHDGSGLASWAYASSISAVTNNIIKAAGLTEPGEEGRYPGHSAVTCYYISAATSLDNADVILDNALWATSGLIADVSNRLDDLSGVTREFSANTVEALSALSRSVDERIESGLTLISGVVENYVEEMLSGLNFDEIYEYIDSADTALYEYIDNSIENLSGSILECVFDNEEVTAAALNDLNDRIHDLSGTTLIGLEELSGSVVNNESAITVLSAIIEDNELVIAAAFNDLNDRILENRDAIDAVSGKTCGVLTLNLNGVEQGKYSPSANTTINLEAIQEVTGEDVLLTNYVISCGSTEAELEIKPTDNVNEAFGKLEKKVEDNELVAAAAFNDLNVRIIDLSEVTEEYYNELNQKIANLSGGGASEEDLEALSASVVYNQTNINAVSGDVIALSASVIANKNNITNLSAYTKDVDDKVKALSAGTVQGLTYLSGVIEDNELVIAAAFNDLNDRVLELSANTPDMTNYYNKTEVNQIVEDATQRKYTTANTLTDLAFNEFLTIVKIGGNTTLSIGNSLPTLPVNGVAERHVIIENTGNTDAVVTLASDSRVKLTMNDKIAIDRQGIGEFNALITYDGSAYTIYVITT